MKRFYLNTGYTAKSPGIERRICHSVLLLYKLLSLHYRICQATQSRETSATPLYAPSLNEHKRYHTPGQRRCLSFPIFRPLPHPFAISAHLSISKAEAILSSLLQSCLLRQISLRMLCSALSWWLLALPPYWSLGGRRTFYSVIKASFPLYRPTNTI
jgi:hypothetical protein